MSLPDLQALKDRLRIEDDAATGSNIEDDDLEMMLASAAATIEESIGRPVTSTERTWIIEYPSPNWDRVTPATSFFLPLYPVKHDDDDQVVMLDADGDPFVDFRVNTTTGLVVATGGETFDNWPYTVTAIVGIDLMPGYSTRVEPKLSQAFLDLCADWYQRRNPGALAEGAGGGVITQWQTLGVPERICQQLDAFRLAKAH